MRVELRQETCPRCRGYGTEMEMQGPMAGHRIDCRDCSGSGWRDDEFDDDAEDDSERA